MDVVHITQNHAIVCRPENVIVEAIASVWIVEIQAVEHTANFIFCLVVVPELFSNVTITQ